MVNIYDYIKSDHEKVSHFFKQFEKASSDLQMREIVELISLNLFVHAEAEQYTFYNAIETHPDYKKEIAHAVHEHDDILKLLTEINSNSAVSDDWKRKVLELKKQVEHHVKEEENKIFSDAKKIFSEAEAWILKEKMHDYKEKIFEKLSKNKEV
jgi:predicted acetyltransferase